ncbi:hypothetical protein [Paenibacillus sp. 3LSP]|uniref:hypothetical protein n=1 Tax=Paenibacillus sp. 3LSP TaxID=2800795 RepID=UPI002905D658|nr:hypothetical protein [Paenibacillus sp. 3LSP]
MELLQKKPRYTIDEVNHIIYNVAPYWLQEVKKLCEVNQQEQRKILGLRIRLNAEKERADQAEAREQMLREAIEAAIENINHEAFRTACNGLEDVLASLYPEEGTK